MEDKSLENMVDNIFSIYPMIYKNLMKTTHECMNISMPHAHYQIIFILEKFKELSVTEISKRVCISKPQMTVLIDKLVEDGLVERTHSSNDRRVINISLTEKGKEFVKQYKLEAKSNMKNKLRSLSEDDLKSLYSALDVVKNITSKIKENT